MSRNLRGGTLAPHGVMVGTVDVVVGRSRLLSAAEGWDVWFDGPGVSEDFMAERDQPLDEERSPL